MHPFSCQSRSTLSTAQTLPVLFLEADATGVGHVFDICHQGRVTTRQYHGARGIKPFLQLALGEMPWKRWVYSPFKSGFRWRRVLSPSQSILNLLLFPQRHVEYVAQEVIRAPSPKEGVLVVAGRGPTDR